MVVEPVILEGRHIRLEPLSLDHIPQLCEVGLDPEIWRWTTSFVGNPADMRTYVETALRWRDEGTALPFVTIDKILDKVVGSTRYANIDNANRRLEIGWTWLGRQWQRTHVNTEAKYLLLQHAFESLGCIRVEFKTDALNEPARKALQRIGAKEEGILRRHMITEEGRIRDTVYYSIIDEEWPSVKAMLEGQLNRRIH